MSNKEVFTQAIRKVNWALQEANKIAVHQAGITDWSKERPERTHQVEMMQMEIATMILSQIEKKKN